MFFKLSCKLKHRFILQHLIHIKIVVFLNINLRIWYAECWHQHIFDPSDSKCHWREKWNENGKKSLNLGIQGMHQNSFILKKMFSTFSLEYLLTPKLNEY